MGTLAKDHRFVVVLLSLTIGLGVAAAGLSFINPGRVAWESAGSQSAVSVPASVRDPIPIQVDAAVEFFSVIHRLAGTGQYDENGLPTYVNEVWDHFGPYRDHPAVSLARMMNLENGINGNAPMDLAIHLTPPPELALRAPVELVLEDLDSRWKADLIPPLLEVARKFALDTDFQSFFKAHHPFYDQAVESLRSTLAGADMIPWFGSFFGEVPDRYTIVLGLLNGSCNYGSRVTFPDGSQEFVSMLGGLDPHPDGVPRFARQRYVPTIVHEFSHSYVNPLVDRNLEALRPAGETLFSLLEEDMHRWGYDYWYVMLYEYLVRASTLRYLTFAEGVETAESEALQDLRAGFPGTLDLAEILEEYEADRVAFPNLQAFLPRLVDFFAELADSLG